MMLNISSPAAIANPMNVVTPIEINPSMEIYDTFKKWLLGGSQDPIIL